MTCLREQGPEGRVGGVQCEEDGCNLQRISGGRYWFVDYVAPELLCVLHPNQNQPLKENDDGTFTWA